MSNAPTLALTPHGRLVPDALAGAVSDLDEALAHDDASALINLAARGPHDDLGGAAAWFRDLARGVLASAAASGTGRAGAPPNDLAARIGAAPPFTGREYLDAPTASALWHRLAAALDAAVVGTSLEPWLAARNAAWCVVGRVCFHLAENKATAARPFAFLATYTTGLGAGAKEQHRPLGQAAAESAATGDRAGLLKLLVPVTRAAERSPFVKALVDSQAVFRPQAWTAAQAHGFLCEVPAIEESGVSVRIPDWWGGGRPRVRVNVQVDAGNGDPLRVCALAITDDATILALCLRGGRTLRVGLESITLPVRAGWAADWIAAYAQWLRGA